MKAMADVHRRDVQFEEGDLVYLKIRPYKQRSIENHKNEKLAPRFYGPYEVLEKIGAVAYKLKRHPYATIHPVFHVSQLRKAIGATQLPQPLPSQLALDMELHVEPTAVLGIGPVQMKRSTDQEVLIKWKDLPEFEATWELSSVIQQQFPHFHLEDKVRLLAGVLIKPPFRYTYVRRSREHRQGGRLAKGADLEEESGQQQGNMR